MTEPENNKRINNNDLWKQIVELDKKLVELHTDQKWVMTSLMKIQETAVYDLTSTTEQIKELTNHVNEELALMNKKISELENANWYQKGFYAGIGAIVTLAFIIIPNLNKIF